MVDVQKIQERLAELQTERDQCDRDARQLESQSREKRARYSECKADALELSRTLTDAVAVGAAQKSQQAAEAGRLAAENAAQSASNSRTELDELVTEARGLIATLNQQVAASEDDE